MEKKGKNEKFGKNFDKIWKILKKFIKFSQNFPELF